MVDFDEYRRPSDPMCSTKENVWLRERLPLSSLAYTLLNLAANHPCTLCQTYPHLLHYAELTFWKPLWDLLGFTLWPIGDLFRTFWGLFCVFHNWQLLSSTWSSTVRKHFAKLFPYLSFPPSPHITLYCLFSPNILPSLPNLLHRQHCGLIILE